MFNNKFINKNKLISLVTATIMFLSSSASFIKTTTSAVQSASIRGDANNDGVVNVFDVINLRKGSSKISLPLTQDYVLGKSTDIPLDGYNAEPQARVILSSAEKTETKMTVEMAALADKLGTPLAIYDYLYNKVKTEFYLTSRKGAIGTYEQNSGNDVDCASLLIAMLRYKNCKAEYVTGTVGLTEQQLVDLTATNNIITALKVFGIHGIPITKSGTVYNFQHTWVKATIDGKDYNLDIGIKKYQPVKGLNDKIAALNTDIDLTKYNEMPDFNFYMYEAKKQMGTGKELVNLLSKTIVSQKITALPTSLPYSSTVKEEIHDIIESKLVPTDGILFGFAAGNAVEPFRVYSPRAYISTITIGYVPNKMIYLEYDEPVPKDIYSLSNNWLASVTNTVSPALYIDNVNVYEWNNSLTSIGQLQNFYIGTFSATSTSSSSVETKKKELLVGSINSIAVDTQNISPHSLLTAYSRLDAEKGKITQSNVFDDKYFGNYLNLMGTSYFSQLDIEKHTLSSASGVYTDRALSYGVFSYVPDVTKNVAGQFTLQKRGNFTVDIMGNVLNSVSLKGKDDVGNFDFSLGYTSSKIEYKVLEQFTGIKSVSTTEVFSVISRRPDIDFNFICQYNVSEVDKLAISNTAKNEIRTAANEGKHITVPNKNVTINGWTGTAYIITDEKTGEVSYKLSNGTNGGSTTQTSSLVDLVNYVSLQLLNTADIVLLLQMSFAIYQYNPMLFYSFTPLILLMLENLEGTVSYTWSLYKAACAGNPYASEALAFYAQLSALTHSLIFANAIAEAVSDTFAKNNPDSFLNTALSNLKAYFLNRGCSADTVEYIWTGNYRADGALMYAPTDFTVSVLKMPPATAGNVFQIIDACDDIIINAIRACSNPVALANAIAAGGSAFTNELVRYYSLNGGTGVDILVKRTQCAKLIQINSFTDSVFKNNIEVYRKMLPPWAQQQPNFGYCHANIGILTKTDFFAYSAIDDLIPSVEGSGISLLPDASPFKPLNVNSDYIINGDKAYLRNVDSEFKILSDIQKSLGSNYKASGKITLYTDLSPCPSCEYVINQFAEMYPNIEIEVVYSKK